MTARSSRPGHEWVQPIVVSKNSTHEEAVEAVARASVAVWSEQATETFPNDNYVQWLDGPFTKTVRRASMNEIARLLDYAEDGQVPHVAISTADGKGTALAFPPMRYSEMPKLISKLQVHGTDFERATNRRPLIERNENPAAPVAIWVDESLTTGKAAAAAAHALWAWLLPLAHTCAFVDALDVWEAAGRPIVLHFVDAKFLAAVATTTNAHPIIDAGLTEVDPNTLTAVATLSLT